MALLRMIFFAIALLSVCCNILLFNCDSWGAFQSENGICDFVFAGGRQKRKQEASVVRSNQYEEEEQQQQDRHQQKYRKEVSSPKSKLTSQIYVIGFHQKDVEGKFRDKNAHTGLFDAAAPSARNKNGTLESKTTSSSSAVTNPFVKWFPAVDGRDPKVLEEWSFTVDKDFPKLTPEMGRLGPPDPNKNNTPNSDLSPHVVGCFESHRRLLQGLLDAWGLKSNNNNNNNNNFRNHNHNYNYNYNTPDALFVFEEDAHCVHDTYPQIMDLLPKLPHEWDMLFIGGKPNSRFAPAARDPETDKALPVLPGYSPRQLEKLRAILRQEYNEENKELRGKTFRELACNGTFGVSYTGPFGPKEDDTIDRNRKTFHLNQDYWKINYILNTHSYVVNPRKIGKILKVLDDMKAIQNPLANFLPLDVAWAKNMRRSPHHGLRPDKLNVYLPAKGEYCTQGNDRLNYSGDPFPWEGHYMHKAIGPFWDELYFSECPEAYANGLL